MPDLAEIIKRCQQQPEYTAQIAAEGQKIASDRFTLKKNQQQIDQLLQAVLLCKTFSF